MAVVTTLAWPCDSVNSPVGLNRGFPAMGILRAAGGHSVLDSAGLPLSRERGRCLGVGRTIGEV